MMGAMDILALMTGVLIAGWVFSGYRIDYVLTLLYFASVRNRHRFEPLYDLADDETTFSFNSTNEKFSPSSYTEYLRLHEDARETAYERFRVYYDALLRLFTYKLLPFTLLPAILFWSRWYAYLLGVLLTFAAWVTFKTYIRGCRIGFYQRMMIGAILSNYQKEQQHGAKRKRAPNR